MSRNTSRGCASLPVPDLIVTSEQLRKAVASYPLDAVEDVAGPEAAIGEILGEDIDGNAFGDERSYVVGKPRRLRLTPAAKGEPGGVLSEGGIVDGVAAQQHAEIG